MVYQRKFVMVFAAVALVFMGGCKSMQPKPGRPGVDNTRVTPPKPPQVNFVNRDAPLRESSQSELERNIDALRDQQRIQDPGLLSLFDANPNGLTGLTGQPALDGGVLNGAALNNAAAVNNPAFDAFPATGEDGSLAAPLPGGVQVQSLGFGIGQTVDPTQSRGGSRSGSVAQPATHGAASGAVGLQ